MNPKVLNIKTVGWNYPNSIYCGRPTKWGNSFISGIHGNRTEVIRLHSEDFLKNDERIKEAKEELKDKNLLCWCSPKSCHCDIYLEVANSRSLFTFI